jgi:tetratricopeptide (TPR) repeat protein
MSNSTNDKGYSSIRESVCNYETMLRNKQKHYFDVVEFEKIIDHYTFGGKYEEAVKAIDFALKMHPDSSKIKLKKVHFLIDQGKLKIAMDILIKLQISEPSEPEIYFLFGAIYIDKETFDTADSFFSKAIQLGYDNADNLAGIGFLFEQKSAYSKAISYLDKAYRKNKDMLFVLYEIAFCYEKLGDFRNSIHYYEKYIKQDPFSETAWYNLGVAAESLKLFHKAIEAYDYALALKPDFMEALLAKADVMRKNEDYHHAISLYREYLETEKNELEALSHLADCYSVMKDFTNAEMYRKKAMSLIRQKPQ